MVKKKKTNKKQPKWSIIVRTQGKRNEFLLEALYSIALQSYDNKDVILVVHAKGKRALKGIENLVHPLNNLLKINILQADYSKRRGHPLNVGLDNCNSKYVSFLDDDDILYPHAGEKLIEELEKGQRNFVCGIAIALNQRQIGGRLFKNTGKHIFYNKEFNPVELASTNFIPINDYIYNFNTFKELRFDEDLDLLEDWDLLLQMITSGKLRAKFIPIETCEYRFKDDNSQSFTIYTKKELLESRQIINKKYRGKKIQLDFDDVFLIYPDVNNISPLDEEDADIGRMRKEKLFVVMGSECIILS